MASSQAQDKRLLERAQRRGDMSKSQVEEELSRLADLHESIQHPSEEEVERLRSELGAEREARAERIERFLTEEPQPPVRPEPIPIDEADL